VAGPDPSFRIVEVLGEPEKRSDPTPASSPRRIPWKLVAIVSGGGVILVLAAVFLLGRSEPTPDARGAQTKRNAPLARPVGSAPKVTPRPETKPEVEPAQETAQVPAQRPPPASAPSVPESAASPGEGSKTAKADFEKALAAERFEEAEQVLMNAGKAQEREGLQWVRDARRVLTARKSFAAKRPEALARLARAREGYLREIQEGRERELAIEKLLKKQTERSPIRVVLQDGYAIDNVRVASYARGRVRFVWPQGEIEHSLETLPKETQKALIGGALDSASSRECLEIGKLFVHGGSFDLADRCFKRVADLEPALKPLCPDIARLRQLSRIFEGDFKLTGSLLGVRWNFRDAAEAGDFKPVAGKCAVSPRQGLEFTGDKLAYATIKEVPFRDQLKVSAVARKADKGAHLLGVQFVRPDGGEVIIYAIMATGLKAFLVKRLEDEKTTVIVPSTPYAGDDKLEMDFNRGRFIFRIGGKTLWSGLEGGFTDISAILGGSTLTNDGAGATVSAAFSEVVVQGGVNPEWVRKEMAGYRAVLASELSREHRIRMNEKEESSVDLSLDVLLPEVEEPARLLYSQAMQTLREYYAAPGKVGIEAPRQALEEAAAKDPRLANPWFFRASLEDSAGNTVEAAKYYDQAISIFPDFPEALAARAHLHILGGEWAKARELSVHALKLKPDLGEAYLIQARLLMETGKGAEALESAGVARELSTEDADLQAQAQMLGNLVRGPGWVRTNEHKTAHYTVRSDLPEEKCRTFALNLEAMRTVYEQVLPGTPVEGKTAQVLVFNTHEGYHSYMDFTSGDRLEHTLGLFSPWYGQMVLFEDPEPEETLRVLYHEGFHQFLKGVMPVAPIWFNEGMAEYVGASRIKDGRVVETGGLQGGRLRDLKTAVKYGWKTLPFTEIMNETQAEFYGKNASLQYAQAWSMIHFFMLGEGGRWSGVLREYGRRLAAGARSEEAFQQTFAKEDLDALEASWVKYYSGQELAGSGSSKAPAVTPGAATVKATEAAEAKKARELRVNALRDSLSSKDEKVRIRAIYELGEVRDRTARSLLADKLGSDTVEVRRAAATALSKQKHPAAAAALGNALAANRNNADLLGYLIGALEELDMDDSIKPLLSVLEFSEYDSLEAVLGSIEKIGCTHAIPELVKWLKRAENEEKKPTLNKSKDMKLTNWAPRLRAFLAKMAGGTPRPGESWDSFIDRGGISRKMISIYYCEAAGKTFETQAGKGKPDCPYSEPNDRHEDTLLKHRPE
jgi:tetratricopeptide (TPR) repeat protein